MIINIFGHFLNVSYSVTNRRMDGQTTLSYQSLRAVRSAKNWLTGDE